MRYKLSHSMKTGLPWPFMRKWFFIFRSDLHLSLPKRMNIPFNKPHITGKEVHYIYDVASGHISGNGKYTKMCQKYFEERWGFKKALLTTSCTDAPGNVRYSAWHKTQEMK